MKSVPRGQRENIVRTSTLKHCVPSQSFEVDAEALQQIKVAEEFVAGACRFVRRCQIA